MDWFAGVAMRFTSLTLDRERNRLRRDGYVEACARLALLVDLASTGQLTGPEELQIDTTAVGFVPADTLLAAVASNPSQSLAFWIGTGPAVMHSLADQWVARGNWRRAHGTLGLGRFYQDLGPEPVSNARASVSQLQRAALGDASIHTASDAAVVALALIADQWRPMYEREPGTHVPPALTDACGAAAWLIDAGDQFIAHSRLRSAAADSDRWWSTPPGDAAG